jgi:hypothetical protein
MKQLLSLVLPLLVTTAPAQTPKPHAACGPADAIHRVTASDDISIPEPQPGMATLVFIEDELQQRPGHAPCVHCTTRLRLGMDGQWIAATAGSSHISILVAPGEHHFCADPDSATRENPQPSMYGMQIEAGKTYFLRARLALFAAYDVRVLELGPVNEDEGRFLVSTSKQSSFTPK